MSATKRLQARARLCQRAAQLRSIAVHVTRKDVRDELEQLAQEYEQMAAAYGTEPARNGTPLEHWDGRQSRSGS